LAGGSGEVALESRTRAAAIKIVVFSQDNHIRVGFGYSQ